MNIGSRRVGFAAGKHFTVDSANAAATHRVPQYVGNIYPFTGEVVRGWLADKRNLEQPVTFGFYIDSELKGEFFADRSRKHLRDQKLGTGEYGFDVPVDPAWNLKPGTLIAVRPTGAEFFELVQRIGGDQPAAPVAPKAAKIDRAAAMAFMKSVDDDTLAKMLRELRNVEVLSRARGHFATKNWESLVSFHRVLIGVSKEYERLLMLVGRAALYTNDHATAMRILAVGAALFPAAEELHYYCGVAHARAGRPVEAVPHFRAALRLLPNAARTKRELSNTLRRASRDAGSPRERVAMISEAADLMREALDQEYNRASAIALIRLLYDLGQNEEAVERADRLLEEKPDEIPVMLLKSRNLVALNRISEALAIAQAVIKLDPLDQTARFQVRALRFLDEGESALKVPTFGDLAIKPGGEMLMGDLGKASVTLAPAGIDAANLGALLSEGTFDWLRLVKGRAARVDAAELTEAVDPFAGFVEYRRPGATAIKLWRREAIVQLLESNLIGPDLAGLSDFEKAYQRTKPAAKGRPTAIVLSRHGRFKFGGGEQFIESMAEHYRSVGYDPIIVGVRPELVGTSGEEDGFRYAFVEQTPAALRKLFLETDAKLVHVISGLGFTVADALAHTNIPFIYGVHFWREALGGDSDEGYFDEEGRPVPRAEFRYILSRAASVYANSQYTRSILQSVYGVRCPVIYSVPRELERRDEA